MTCLSLIPRGLFSRRKATRSKEVCPEGKFMETQSQNAGNQNRPNQPPTPGGDPDQPPTDLPNPRPGQDKGKDKVGFGHIGNKDVPSSDRSPEPHNIF
jgi:hypothetical protein